MEKIRILVVEDELIIAEDIADILRSSNYEVCDICKSYQTAVLSIEKYTPDLVLLDIKIKGEKDGIDLATYIRDNHSIPFVFISSHSDAGTVKRAVSVNPYGYLIKPFEDSDVTVAVEVALSNFAKEQTSESDEFILNDCLFVRDKNLSVKVQMKDILHVKAEGNYSIITTESKSFVLRSTLKDLEVKLPNSQFFRSHKSYVINLNHISAINSDCIFINNEKLPVGRGQLHHLMERINKI